MAYCGLAGFALIDDRMDAALEWGGKAIELAESLDDAEPLAHALASVGAAEIRAGLPEGHAKIERSVRLAAAAELPEHVLRAPSVASTSALEAHDYAAAERYIDQALAFLEARRCSTTCWSSKTCCLRCQASGSGGRRSAGRCSRTRR
jgi:hypothetical protein